jgi:Glycosyl hydrolase family 57
VLSLFTVFHLNLAYSSIEEEQRPQVVRDCYWPLLRLARQHNLPFGIEASAYTLQAVAEIDPAWIAELRSLTAAGPCEFVGSGYAQLIGPLVPAEVNAANLRLGNDAYRSLLGFQPAIALVNEQAYSVGLLQHYIDAGYKAIVMEWGNPARRHPEWKAEWRYFPQIACGQHGEELPLIWNKSIAFQKFQRYAHGEMDLPEYIDYLARHATNERRAFPLYGNDIEVFDFRPGRYHTEPERQAESEWLRIERLMAAIAADSRFSFMRPGQVLDLMNVSSAGQRLHLETPQDPVPVKKQEKYNLNRWAVTGRNDLAINTACWRIYEALQKRSEGAAANDRYWHELCYLWSSDFRTHITEKRWRGYRERLARCERELGLNSAGRTQGAVGSTTSALPAGVKIDKGDRYLTLEVDGVVAKLNHRRGLAIDQLYFKRIADEFLVGTLHHGYYDDIALGADFYTGHLVLEAPAQPKVTDLNPVEAQARWNEEHQRLEAAGTVETRLGPIHKTVSLDRNGVVGIRYELGWETMPVGALRLGHVTLNPAAFLARDLYYETHNGGTAERYRVEGNRIEHGRSVSFLVSSVAAIGITAGAIRIGDGRRALSLHVDKSIAALVGQVTYTPAGDSYFFRVSLSAAELDDTTRERPPGEFPRVFEFTLQASAQ